MCVSGLSQLHITENPNSSAFNTERLVFLRIIWILMVTVHDWQGGSITSRMSQFPSLFCYIIFSLWLVSSRLPCDHKMVAAAPVVTFPFQIGRREKREEQKEACLPADCSKSFPRCLTQQLLFVTHRSYLSSGETGRVRILGGHIAPLNNIGGEGKRREWILGN